MKNWSSIYKIQTIQPKLQEILEHKMKRKFSVKKFFENLSISREDVLFSENVHTISHLFKSSGIFGGMESAPCLLCDE